MLACNEMAMPFSSPKPASMFPAAEWNETENTAQCEAAYGMTPQYDWALTYFGGRNPKKDFMKVRICICDKKSTGHIP